MQSAPVDPKRARKNAGCIAIFVLFVIVALAAGLFIQRLLPRVTASHAATPSMACLQAQDFAKEQLKAPSTAIFASCASSDSVVTQLERIWTVRSWVDSQNSFGAQLRNHFTAKLIYYPADDRWDLTSLTFDD